MSAVLDEIRSDESRLEMTPMIDVTFLLLIFFMCTIKFRTLEGKLSAYLPKSLGESVAPPIEEQRVDLVVTVDEPGSRRDPYRVELPWSGQGAFQYGPDRRLDYRLGPRDVRSLDELAQRLVRTHEADSERGMTIVPGQGTVHADIIGVLDTAIAAGFLDISFRARAR